VARCRPSLWRRGRGGSDSTSGESCKSKGEGSKSEAMIQNFKLFAISNPKNLLVSSIVQSSSKEYIRIGIYITRDGPTKDFSSQFKVFLISLIILF
jgi:hypothetical protein